MSSTNTDSDRSKDLYYIQQRFSHEQWGVALDFLKIGLNEFHERRNSDWKHYQPALANLGIGIELATKAYLTTLDLSLIFTDLPDDVRAALSRPDKIRRGFRWHSVSLDLRSAVYKTIELDKALSFLYSFRPEIKTQLHSVLKHLSRPRNVSVHGVSPMFERYFLERVAHAAVTLVAALSKDSGLTTPYSFLTARDKQFVDTFIEARIKRVQEALEAARLRAKSITGESWPSADGFEEYVAKCPVCQLHALYTGYTELGAEMNEDGGADEFLTFHAEGLVCDNCGLSLSDWTEISLVGGEYQFDRTDELDKWERDLNYEYD